MSSEDGKPAWALAAHLGVCEARGGGLRRCLLRRERGLGLLELRCESSLARRSLGRRLVSRLPQARSLVARAV